MKIDVIRNDSNGVVERLAKLGFDSVFLLKESKLRSFTGKESSELTAYSGNDYDFVIRKGKATVVYDLEKNGFLLNKGLCSKLKENKMFVVFSFSSLVKGENIFRVYKNLLINGKICNDYGINCIYSSGSEDTSDTKSFFQLMAFADEFGYSYKNLQNSILNLQKLL